MVNICGENLQHIVFWPSFPILFSFTLHQLKLMKLGKRQGLFLQKVIDRWVAEGVVNDSEAERLRNSFSVQAFSWKKLAKYSFWIALVCALISVSAIVADNYIIEWIEHLFLYSNLTLCVALGIISTCFYLLGLRGRRKRPEMEFANEALIFAGVLFTAGSVAYLGRLLDNGSGRYSLLFLLAALIYGALGFWFPSPMVWIFALITSGAWYCTEIGYQSRWHGHYLGMNYPLTFAFFGLGLVAVAFIFKFWPRFLLFYKPTLQIGLLCLFVALWVLSVFGDYYNLDEWYQVKQSSLVGWSLLLAGFSLTFVIIGIRTDNPVLRGFGIIFFFINLYTLYFEYLWNNMHKALFFFIMALSFWLLGSLAERIWYIGSPHRNGGPSISEEILEE
jgi:uncharacterized membrane protein